MVAGPAWAGVDYWTRTAASPPDFQDLVVDPCRADVIYGVNDGEGVFVSHDLGRTWVTARQGLSSPGPPLVAVPDCAPGRAAQLWTLRYPGYRSEDGGGSWTSASAIPGLPGNSVSHLAVSPAFPKVVYARVPDGIARSDDGGHTWAMIRFDFYVTALAVSPDDSDRVVALWEPEVGGPRLLVSRDGGRDRDGWEERPTPWTGRPWPWWIDHLAVAPGDPDRLWLIGADPNGRFLWATADGGSTWRRLDAVPFHAPRLLAFDLTVEGRFLVAADDGLFETRDGGATWLDRSRHDSRPLPSDAAIRSVEVDPRQPFRVWVSVEGEGVFLDRGRGWEARSGRPVPPFGLLAPDPRRPDVLWAVDGGDDAQLWRSEDAGAHWTSLGAVPASRRYHDLHVDRADGATVLLATAEALHRRPPGGPWQAFHPYGWNEGSPRIAQTLAPEGSTATLCAGAGAWVWMSTDSSAGWAPHRLADGGPVVDLQPGRQPEELVVVTPRTVWETSDGGISWQARTIPGDVGSVTAAVADPTRPGTLYVTSETVLWSSRDGGIGWTPTPLPPHSVGGVRGLTLTATDPGTLYVSSGRTLWRSRDAGATWEEAGEGLFGDPVLVPDPLDPRHLYSLSWNGLLDVRQVDAPPQFLGGGRFRVSAAWYEVHGSSTPWPSTPAPGWRVSDEGAVFRFAGAGNPEVAIKVLDGRGVNGHFWWFATSLTNLRHEVTVVDRASGVAATRLAPRGVSPARFDLQGLPDFPGLEPAPPPEQSGVRRGEGSPDESDALSLVGGRFRLELQWRDPAGGVGIARAVPFNDQSGYFRIFRPGRMELVVKLLAARPMHRYWLFAGTSTNLELWLVVTDTQTGDRRVYHWRPGDRRTVVDLDLPG